MKHIVFALLLCMAFSVYSGFRSASDEDYAADFVNSIGMKFTTIPAGSFYMGSCKLSSSDEEENKKRQFMGLSPRAASCPSGAGSDSDASDDETPQHLVKISRAYQMGVHEVTLGQFKQFIAGAGRGNLLSEDFMKYNNQGDNAPVVEVSWDDAQDFIAWLNRKEGGSRYRLPTEAQWEYAARAETTNPYSFSGHFSDYAWYRDNSGEHQHAVGQKRPNAYGLYDMHGNVWEWCSDWYGEHYYRNSSSNDPQGPGSGEARVLRGGSWFYHTWYLRSADRDRHAPVDRHLDVGFRLSRM